MANTEGIPDLGPLPQSDDNAELQRTSIKVLNSLLQDQDAILFRDERTEDYGVDGAFELKIGGRMTNFRAQVQLKGTASVEGNQDGSISLCVRTANLNYLLNGTSPIYVLFDAKKKEFWYVWAQDESRRLEAANSTWKEQREVTLRFNHRLAAHALDMIVERVMREGRMHRQIHDSLARATTNEPIVISIDTASLETTDPSQAQHLLLASGPAIVAAGYPKRALQLLELVDSATRNLPRLQLTAGFAEYMLGKHFNALGHIRQAMVRTQELSERDRTFLTRLKDACEFHVGIIDSATYRQRTDEWARALNGLESLDARLEVVYYRFLSERDREVRAALTKETHEITGQILSRSDATEAARLRATLTLLYVEGAEATRAVTRQLGLFRMRASVFAAHTKAMLRDYRDATTRLANWEASSSAALKRAHEVRNPILIGEAFTVVLGVLIPQLLNQRVDALFLDKVFEIPEPTVSKVLEGIASALAINELNGTVEGRLRVDILKADFLEIMGNLAGAKELAAQIHPEAEAMGFADIAERAKELLDDRTLLMEFEREWARFKQTDEDVSFASLSDDEVRQYARDILLSLGSPPDRLRVIQENCQSLREVARERCHWCRHLQMLEDRRQTRDPETAFSTVPNRRYKCDKFGYETAIITSDAQALIGAFKQLYCASCKDRSPKQA